MNDLAKTSDLTPGVYGGGFKLWEGTFDAVLCLSKMTFEPTPQRILDLGCGSGLGGFFCLLNFQSSHVVFHDLNESVLKAAVSVNITLNLGPTGGRRSTLLFGPWEAGYARLFQSYPFQFDLIMTTETLYEMTSHRTLHKLFCEALAPNGRIIVASKRYYFGVGGGMMSFVDLVKQLGVFTVTYLETFADGSSNLRDVVLLQRII